MKKTICLLLTCLALAPGGSLARTVKGTVSCGNERLAGVLVTDGTSFTTTSPAGRYTIDVADSAAFVYVITPSGYTVDCSSGTPVFYQKLGAAKRYDFSLVKDREGGDYTLLCISDPQCRNKKQFAQFCAEPLRDICSQVERYAPEGIVAGLMLGDIGWDSFKVVNPLFKKTMPQVPAPMYPVIGNHDFDMGRQGREARRSYEDDFGPVNYAFWLGEDLVVVLKNIIYDTQKKYVEGYTDEEFTFMKGLLEHIPADTHLFVAQHSPLHGWFRSTPIVRGEEMVALLDGRRVDFVSGHTHISNNYAHTPTIREHNPAALCGAWWLTTWDNDGTPRGYRIFRNRDGVLDWWYHPVDYDDDFQFELILPGHSILHPASLLANVWDYDEAWSVVWYQDGEPKGPMEQVRDVSPTYVRQISEVYEGKAIPGFRRPRQNIHYFSAVPDKEAREIRVVVTNRFGKSWEQTVRL